MAGILSRHQLVIVGKDGKKHYMPLFITKDIFFKSGEQLSSVKMAMFCTTVNGRRLYLPLRYPDRGGLCTMIGGLKYPFVGYDQLYDTSMLHFSFRQKQESYTLYTYMRAQITGLEIGLKWGIYIKAIYKHGGKKFKEETFSLIRDSNVKPGEFLLHTQLLSPRAVIEIYDTIELEFSFNISSDIKTYSIDTGDFSSFGAGAEMTISLYE